MKAAKPRTVRPPTRKAGTPVGDDLFGVGDDLGESSCAAPRACAPVRIRSAGTRRLPGRAPEASLKRRQSDQRFAESVAVSSTSEQCIRLPPSSPPGKLRSEPLSCSARRDAACCRQSPRPSTALFSLFADFSQHRLQNALICGKLRPRRDPRRLIAVPARSHLDLHLI